MLEGSIDFFTPYLIFQTSSNVNRWFFENSTIAAFRLTGHVFSINYRFECMKTF
jgi:hypothetical protein